MKIIDGKIVWDFPLWDRRECPSGKLFRLSFIGDAQKLYVDENGDCFRLLGVFNGKPAFQFYSSMIPLEEQGYPLLQHYKRVQ
jgi:hypothetical protein